MSEHIDDWFPLILAGAAVAVAVHALANAVVLPWVYSPSGEAVVRGVLTLGGFAIH